MGSCYNPIAQMQDICSNFDVVAMDLCPAHESVWKGDFLTLEVLSRPGDEPSCSSRGLGMKEAEVKQGQGKELLGLVESQFDAITMSLVLSYLPTPEAREVMVDKARALLVTPSVTKTPHHKGLFIIVEKTSILATPSQKHMQQSKKSSKSSTSVNTMVSVDDWKEAICARGFECVTYQYLPTSDGRKSHVFVFAAVDFPEGYDPSKPKPRLHIKQDFYTQQHSQDVCNDKDS